jgi:predicted naringenin-chalcone synthase
MSAYLCDFHVIRPRFEVSQQETLEWIASMHARAAAKSSSGAVDPGFHREVRERFWKVGIGPEKIQKRGTQLSDLFHTDRQCEVYDQSERPEGLGMQARMRFFEASVNQLFEQFYPKGCKAPAHLIHVTCTGYVSPSGAQHLVAKRGFGQKTQVAHAYHMGCYASIPAMRMAAGFLRTSKSPHERADLVHTELCSLHINPLLHETEQLVVQSLFADGFIKYSVSKKPGVFKIFALHEEILPETTAHMSWRCADWGLRMSIAKEVPVVISRALPSFVARIKQKANKPLRNLFFAIHPGGPKIIDQVKKALKLSDEQVLHSQEVLCNYGNMSSATLPHVWEKMARDPNIKPKSGIVSLAFGPGLTACGGIFEKLV